MGSRQEEQAAHQRRMRQTEAAYQQNQMDEQRRREARGGGGGGGELAELLGIVLGVGVLILILLWLIRVIAVSLIAVLPIAVVLWFCTRVLGRREDFAFGSAFKPAFIGMFVYLAFTTTTALVLSAAQMGAKT